MTSPWSALLGTRPVKAPSKPPATKAQRIRTLLRERGPLTTREIMDALPSLIPGPSYVSALLRQDIKQGYVFYDARRWYLADAFDPDLPRDVQNAITLLRQHGYTVRREA